MANKVGNSLYRGFNRRRADFALRFAALFFDTYSSESDVALACSLALRKGDVEELLSIGDRDISSFSGDPDSFSIDYACSSLLSKFPFKNYRDLEARKAVAMTKFLDSEESCIKTESNLRHKRETVLHPGVTAASLLHVMQRKISRVLGKFSWNCVEQFGGFGPGASTRLPRKQADAYYKMGDIPHVTHRCADVATVLVARIPLWEESIRGRTHSPLSTHSFQWVPGNRITTVPKNAKCERVIAIEPDLNLWVQKGIGGLIRERLRRHAGIDLNSQVHNQSLARLGVEFKLSTIDLASASDTVSLSLVQEILPPDWSAAVEHCRSPFGLLPDGTHVLYRKVSSMGNGFTFELESLIFWSAIQAVYELIPGAGGKPHGVYGDDLIIASSHAQVLIDLLAFIGFKTNPDKTFLSGPFRESCGKHYLRNVDVTPFYIREGVDSIERLFWLHNQYVRWIVRRQRSAPAYLEGKERALLDSILAEIPLSYQKFVIPYGDPGSEEDLGDIGLLTPFDKAAPKNLWFGSYLARGLVRTKKEVRPEDDGFLLRQLYGASRQHAVGWEAWGSGVVDNDHAGKVRRITPTVLRWRDPYVLID